MIALKMNKKGKLQEVGILKGAPKAAKAADDKMDKAKGITEGSKPDLKADKAIVKKYGKGKK